MNTPILATASDCMKQALRYETFVTASTDASDRARSQSELLWRAPAPTFAILQIGSCRVNRDLLRRPYPVRRSLRGVRLELPSVLRRLRHNLPQVRPGVQIRCWSMDHYMTACCRKWLGSFRAAWGGRHSAKNTLHYVGYDINRDLTGLQ